MGTCLNCIVKGDLSFFFLPQSIKGSDLGAGGEFDSNEQTTRTPAFMYICRTWEKCTAFIVFSDFKILQLKQWDLSFYDFNSDLALL